MGNALTAVTTGDILSYYNPAVVPFAEYKSIGATFGILSLDRRFNLIDFTTPLAPSAGLSVGIINSGVGNIDGRDSDGYPTEELSTSENQFFLSFSNRFPAGFSVGISIKMYYHKLYDEVTTTTVGIDAGALVPLGDELTVGVSVRDINSSYKWNTSNIYGQQGRTTSDKFPLLYTIGLAYNLPGDLGLAAVDVEASNHKTLAVRTGVELPVVPELTLRAGIDRVDLKDEGNGVRPAFGFTARKELATWTPALTYAFVLEPFASSGMHIITLSVKF